MKSVKNAIKAFFLIYFIWVIIICLLHNNKGASNNNYCNIIIGTIGIILMAFAIRFIDKRIPNIRWFIIGVSVCSVLLFFLQINLIKHYYFVTGWDSYNLFAVANNLANGGDMSSPDMQNMQNYYSMYPNNLFLTSIYVYIIRIHWWLKLKGDVYYSILVVQCFVNSLSAFLGSMLLYRLLKNKGLVILYFCVFSILIGLSPWCAIPYSDQMALVFPISILLIYSMDSNSIVLNGLKWFGILFLTYVGYKIKPQVAIILIAIILIEIFSIKKPDTNSFKRIVCFIACGVAGILVSTAACGLAINSINISTNKESAYGIAHFAMMGANTDTTGMRSQDDVSFSGSFSTKKERNEANWKEWQRRIEKLGVKGTYNLAKQKTILNYNDGTFAWWKEGTFVLFPHTDISALDHKLKSLYYLEEEGGYHHSIWVNIVQSIWLGVLFLMIFSLWGKTNLDEDVLMVSLLAIIGLSLFETIFECRARYLYAYVPIYISTAIIGVDNIIQWCMLKKEKKNESVA